MEENKNLVVEEITENAEHTAEQTAPKMFTQDEVNEIVGKAKARAKAKAEKDYQRKYGELESVLKAGTGKESVEEVTDTFRNFYVAKGIKMPEKPKYSDKDIEVLAKAEADEIIRNGFEDVVEEADRLNEIGAANMTAREKALFVKLTDHIKTTETSRELAAIGITEDVANSAEFKAFASKFNPNTPIRDVYDIYAKTLPKKDIKPMGSVKNSIGDNGGVKEFYTVEEAKRFKKADYDKNPALYEAVQRSMQKW